MNRVIHSYKQVLVLFSLFIGLLLGVSNSVFAIDCPEGSTPETEPASITVLRGAIEGRGEIQGGEGIAGTADGGALIADSQGGKVVKIDPFWGAPLGKGRVLAGGGISLEDNIPATEAQLYFPTYLTQHPNGSVFVVVRNGRYGNSIVREIYDNNGTSYIRGIAGGGSSTENYPMPAFNVDFGQIQSIVSISDLTFLVISNNTTASVWRVTKSSISDGPQGWIAWKIVGDGQSGVTLAWAGGLDVTRTPEGKYKDLLLGCTLEDGTNAILKFTGDWLSGRGEMSFASQPLSDSVYGLVAQPDGSIVFSSYNRVEQVKDAETPPTLIAGGGTVVPPNEVGSIYPFALQVQQVVDLAPVGKFTVTPGTFLMADRAASRFYMYIPQHEYCNPGFSKNR